MGSLGDRWTSRRAGPGGAQAAGASPAARLIPSILPALGGDPLVRRTGLVEGLLGLGPLAGPDVGPLLLPALVHGLQAPLGRPPAGPDRLAPDEHEDRIGVARRQDAQAH